MKTTTTTKNEKLEKGARIWYKGYYTTAGSTSVALFWSDIHDLDFRTKKVIWNSQDLEEQVTEFNADRTLFDWTSYAVGSEFHTAKEKYFSFVEGRKDFHEITFLYDGKIYKTRTSKWSKGRDIQKKADKILKWVEVQTISLMRDDNGEVVSVIEELGKVNHYLDDYTDANDPADYME